MKKRYLIFNILCGLLGIALIPADLFLTAISVYVAGAACAAMVAAFVLFLVKGKGRWVSRMLLGIYTLFCLTLVWFGVYCNPYWNSVSFRTITASEDLGQVMSYAEAKEDLDFVMRCLKKDHPAFREGVPDEVQERYEKALQELKEAEQIDVAMVYRQVQHVVSGLQDGHTSAFSVYEEKHYLKYIAQRTDAGYRLAAVNGRDLSALLLEKHKLYSYEVESWGLRQLGQDVCTLEGLYYLGIPAEGITYTYEDAEGNRETVTCKEEDFLTGEEYLAYNQAFDDEEPFVSYSIEEDRNLAVLTLTQCNYNEVYRRCLREMFQKVKELGIDNVAVDIRNNGGGNSLVADEFLHYLDVDTYRTHTCKWRLGCFFLSTGDGIAENEKYQELTFEGKVYMLTSTGSFSSAMLFAEYIKDNRLGTIIGEAPGNVPSGYGDIAVFRLPCSGLYLQVSTKQFFRADKETEDVLVSPDIACDADDAMERLYELIEP